MSPQKKFYLIVLEALKKGQNPARITKDLKISKQKTNYYIREMKRRGLIHKIGYGTWEITKEVKITPNHTVLPLEVRGHAFIWKIKLPKIENWDKRRASLNPKILGNGKIQQITLKDRKIWLGNTNIIIYDPFSFYGTKATESRKYAAIQLIEILELLENKLNINLKPYNLRPKREHYALVKNSLAIQCNREGKKISIIADDGTPWFTIDNSYNLDELETFHKNTALIDSIGLQNYFNSHRRTKFKVTPEFMLNAVTQVTQNQLLFAKNIDLHFEVLTNIQKTLDKIADTLKGKI